jgi:hypothetical protein
VDQNEYIQALADVPDKLAGSELERRLRGDAEPPEYLLEANDGICAYEGFTDDADSHRAQAWLEERFRIAEERYPAPMHVHGRRR